MAALSQQAAQNAIKGYRKNGLDDQQIIEAMLRRKDNVGSALRQAKVMADESGEIDSTKTVAGLIGLKPQGRVKGNSQSGGGNKNATIGDKLVSYATSFGAGVGKVGAGILQPIAIAGDSVNKGINNVFGTNLSTGAEAQVRADSKALDTLADKKRLQANRTGIDIPKFGGEIAATLPAFMTGAGGSTMTARALDQGVRGAAVGGLQLTENDNVPNQRLYNMAGGFVGGAAGQAGGEVVAKGVGKGVTKLTNAATGNKAPKAKAIDDLGKQYGVRTSVGDIKGGGIIKNTETHLERVPLGMGKFRTAQHSEAKSASEKVLKQLKNIADDTDFKAIPQIEKAAQGGDKNARRILGVVNDAGDDTGKLLQASLEVQAWRKSSIASKLYNKVEKEVVKSGNDIVPPTKTRAAIVSELDKQTASFSPNKVVVRELSEMLENIDDVAKPRTFGNMRVLRSTQGNLADEYGKGTGKGDAYASGVFGRLRTATEDDISSFAANSGNTGIKTAYQKADRYYAGMMQGKEKAFTNAAQSTKPDEIYNTFVKSGKGDGAENFYNALDPKGQATLRLQMAETAADKAWDANREAFSPAKFAGEFESLAEPYGRIFKGDDKKQMDGFVKLMRHVERAGQFKENPPTGVRLTDVGIVSVAMSSPTSAAGGAGVTLLAKTLLTTRAGKNLLLAANKLPAGQQAALDNILKSAAKLAAAQGSKAGQEKASKVADKKIETDNKGLAPSF